MRVLFPILVAVLAIQLVSQASTTLSDCVSLSGELSYSQPPVITPDYEQEFHQYQEMMKECDLLRAEVKCDPLTREARTEQLLRSMRTNGNTNKIQDMEAAEVLCAWRTVDKE